MSLIVAALIRSAGEVLLVRQRGPGEAEPNWALPGGVVEPGELLTDALTREVREETGLQVVDPGRLLYTAVVNDRNHSVAMVFDVAAWRGEIGCADPDGLVMAAEFVPLGEAIARLRALPWRNMGEPIAAHLEGAAAHGALCVYQCGANGSLELAACVAGRG